MCLIGKNIEILTAEEDIVVKKMFDRTVDGGLRSPYEFFRYSSGLQEPVELEVKDGDASGLSIAARIANDCHAVWNEETNEYEYPGNQYIAEGYHSLMPGTPVMECPEMDWSYCTHPVLDCIIPKGAKYAVCKYGCVVSSNIIIPEV